MAPRLKILYGVKQIHELGPEIDLGITDWRGKRWAIVDGIGHIGQQNRTESPERNLHICGLLVFDKGTKTFRWGKNSLSTNAAGATGRPDTKERMGSATSYHIRNLTQLLTNGSKT